MKIFGLEIGEHTHGEFFKEITEFLRDKDTNGKGKAIFTPNPEICLKTLEDIEFLEALQKADYLTSDGIGLYIGYQINKSKIPKFLTFFMLPVYIFNILFRKKYLYEKYGDRICGSDITNSLLEFSQDNDIVIAIIDPSYPKDVEKCESQRTFREKITKKFPKLDFDFYVYSEDNSDQIFENINVSSAQILFSTLGMKGQEISVIKGLELCPKLKLGLGIGSSFDYHTGFQKRAPKVLRDVGFEWLYRIFTSPNKIQRLRRIYQALIIFPVKVILYKK